MPCSYTARSGRRPTSASPPAAGGTGSSSGGWRASSRAELAARGIDPSVVVVSGNAHLIMPWHVAIDQASERRLGKLQIGTTRRGIGPAYADKASRLGIRVQDVLDPKILRQKIEVALAEKNVWLERVYEVGPFELDDVASRFEGYAQRLRPYVGDTSLIVDRALKDGKDVLFEGAQ